ncbi:hypothetical protein J7I98_22635 [Streptomyces sp. ISL-98]|uniref:hypothetical protein n=1 Tax=Streptomyces sp. ISL-98 TaxID=2819192 RepID=UPI001BE9222C|nr:hypothetical protein [Streptomyces sp. ISL-98]MBT2508626.1 hypothetical protein [Streptomyces sp. ISL-98]
MSNHDRAAALRARRDQRNAPDNLQPAAQHTSERPADLVVTSDMIPAPVQVEATGDLSHNEIHDLAVCENAVENLTTATWLAGKALQAICNRKLYRRTHTTFGAYVEERWEISERAAYQMMEEWPLAERLAQSLGKPATASHTRALLPVATRFGLAAAAGLYQQLRARAANENLRLTATITTQVVKAVLKTAGRQAGETQFKEAAQQLMAAQVLPLAAPNAAPTHRALPALAHSPAPALQNFADNHSQVTPPDTGANEAGTQNGAGPKPGSEGTGSKGAYDAVDVLRSILNRVIAIEEDLAKDVRVDPANHKEADCLRQDIVQRLTFATLSLQMSDLHS